MSHAGIEFTTTDDFELCLGEGTDKRCLYSDTIYTVLFGVGCIIAGLIVSAILKAIDESMERKRLKKEGLNDQSDEAGVKKEELPEELQQMTEAFESAARAGRFTGRMEDNIESPFGTPSQSRRGSNFVADPERSGTPTLHRRAGVSPMGSPNLSRAGSLAAHQISIQKSPALRRALAANIMERKMSAASVASLKVEGTNNPAFQMD